MHTCTLLTSDIHLSPHRLDLLALFTQFIQKEAQKATQLYILGDLFETWIGDDHLSDFNLSIAALLKSLANEGTEIFFMAGNRDFLLGEAYCKIACMTLLADPTVILINDESILLSHGDIFCTADTRYQAYRQKIQSPENKKRLLKLPLFIRKAIAYYLRKQSQINQKKLMNILETNKNMLDADWTSIQSTLADYHANSVIHGHTHLPGIDIIYTPDNQRYQRFVLSDWGALGHYLLIKENTPPLQCYFKMT
jgi:UDP-2,3-diacylglucosamine hydrolase